jgi:hypothetical protein
MQKNVGSTDRILRIALGIALLSWVVVNQSDARWFGLIGLVPLATALMNFCPLYTLLGFNTSGSAQGKH